MLKSNMTSHNRPIWAKGTSVMKFKHKLCTALHCQYCVSEWLSVLVYISHLLFILKDLHYITTWTVKSAWHYKTQLQWRYMAAWEPKQSASSYFICSGRYVWSPHPPFSTEMADMSQWSFSMSSKVLLYEVGLLLYEVPTSLNYVFSFHCFDR